MTPAVRLVGVGTPALIDLTWAIPSFAPEKSSNNLFIPVWKQLRGQSLRRKIYAPLAGMRIVRIPARQTSACLIWDAPVPSRCSVALENYDARGDFLRHLMSLADIFQSSQVYATDYAHDINFTGESRRRGRNGRYKRAVGTG